MFRHLALLFLLLLSIKSYSSDFDFPVYACNSSCEDIDNYASLLKYQEKLEGKFVVLDIEGALAKTYVTQEISTSYGKTERLSKKVDSDSRSVLNFVNDTISSESEGLIIEIPESFDENVNKPVLSSKQLIDEPQKADFVALFLSKNQRLIAVSENISSKLGLNVSGLLEFSFNVDVRFYDGTFATFKMERKLLNGKSVLEGSLVNMSNSV
ncbi:hypothetical protein PN836_020065 [Ningiella sp. W23]|uniref:hypothetical protein n=1 Tax=Ningiella sp. W23 TaxID=3023715 RepID=UPI003757A61B